MPAAYADRYSAMPLDEDELGKVTQTLGECPTFVVYWYGHGSYEGAGHMLVSTDGMRWRDADLGHCSCYGPTDSSSFSPPRTLEDLEQAYTEAAYRDVKPLFEAIRSHNWERQ
jgi:hypothetical protein